MSDNRTPEQEAYDEALIDQALEDAYRTTEQIYLAR